MTYFLLGIPFDGNSLKHYGIKGQSWGRRRFQNLDGTLTAAGRRRYGYTDGGSRRAQVEVDLEQRKADAKDAITGRVGSPGSWDASAVNQYVKDQHVGNAASRALTRYLTTNPNGKKFVNGMMDKLGRAVDAVVKFAKKVIDMGRQFVGNVIGLFTGKKQAPEPEKVEEQIDESYSQPSNENLKSQDLAKNLPDKDGSEKEALSTTNPVTSASINFDPEEYRRMVEQYGPEAAARNLMARQRNEEYAHERHTGDNNVDPNTGFLLKDREYSEEEDLARVNPRYGELDKYMFSTNDLTLKTMDGQEMQYYDSKGKIKTASFANASRGSKMNCMLCTTSYELRRRGYDVTADMAPDGRYTHEISDWFVNPKKVVCNASNSATVANRALAAYGMNIDFAKSVISEMKSEPEGSRGNLVVVWGSGGSHSMIYTIKNGEFTIMDGQSNKIYKGADVEKLLSATYVASHTRLDNLEINPKIVKQKVTHS